MLQTASHHASLTHNISCDLHVVNTGKCKQNLTPTTQRALVHATNVYRPKGHTTHHRQLYITSRNLLPRTHTQSIPQKTVHGKTNPVIHIHNTNTHTQPTRLTPWRKAEPRKGERNTRVKQDVEGQKHKHNSQEQPLCFTSPIYQKPQTQSNSSNRATNH